jgi:hypothetical protein
MVSVKKILNDGVNLASKGVKAGLDAANNAKNEVVKKIDVNGNGEIDIEDVINIAIKIPGIQINREKFLRKEFEIHYEKVIVDNAINATPISAGIPAEDIDKIADEVIEYERRCVSGIAAALGMPGGIALVATLPTDIAQYYGYLLRCAQKLMYLYGFPQIKFDEDGVQLDTSTMNELILCLGVMFGVANASQFLKVAAKALAEGVSKKLVNAALMKGAFYPLVKSIAKWFGKRMTKEVFAGFFKKAIPVVGGAIGGGLTYAMFKPCCVRLKNSLKDTKLSNPNHEETEEEKEIYNAVFTVKEEIENTENSQELELK